jgi:NAD(P)-dependent dehydrogenase (short-subunit alcohol dehydrogenase family)
LAVAAATPLRGATVVIVAWCLVCIGALGVAAKRLGPLYGVPLAIAVGLAIDAFYIPPARSFDDWQNVPVVATYLAVGVLVGAIAEASRRRAEVSEAQRGKLADEQAALRRVATLVAQGVDPQEVFAAAAIEMNDLLGADLTRIAWDEADALTFPLCVSVVDEPGTPGRIVCLTSGQSLGPMPGELPYTTTKAALEMFARQLAPEVMALGITVNAVNPGVTDTGWVTDAIRAEVLPRMPAGRLGESEDAARLIAWLCSAEAGWVTGQVIGSEGGFVRG